jgi:hypothetical protein
MAERKRKAVSAKTKTPAKYQGPYAGGNIIFAIVGVVLIGIVAYFALNGGFGTESLREGGNTITTYPQSESAQPNCGDLLIGIISRSQASEYLTGKGFWNVANEGRFEILQILVTNKAQSAEDFSGYRMELVSGTEKSSTKNVFGEIERIRALDGTETDFACQELIFASVSRLTLGYGETSGGCKIFQVATGSRSSSLNVYDVSGLKCSLPIS